MDAEKQQLTPEQLKDVTGGERRISFLSHEDFTAAHILFK